MYIKRIPFITLFTVIFSVMFLGFITSFNITEAQSTGSQQELNYKDLAKEDIKDVQLYVYPIKINSSYQVGSNIEGTFTISNIGNTDAPDSYYTISVGSENGSSIQGESPKKSLLYVKANSKRDIKFNYVLPTTTFGDTYLIVKLYLQDGTVIAEGSQKIYVQGEPQFRSIIPADILVLNNNVVYAKDYGLVLGASDELSVSFSLPEVNQSKAVLNFYKNTIDGEAFKTLDINLIKNENGKYIVKIPTVDSLPGKYIAKISFDDKSFYIQPISVNYVFEGLFSNVKSINSDKLTLSKKENFNLSINYEGYGQAEDSNIEKQMSGATISIIVKNEKNVEIASISSPIDLSQYENTLIIPLTSKESAESLSITTEIKDSSGRVLDNYTNDLPSDKEVSQLYPNGKNYQLIYLVLEILSALILIIILFWLARFNFNKKIKSALVIVGILITSFAFNDVKAFTTSVVSSDNDRQSSVRYFDVGSFSPLPSSVRSYTPGEVFHTGINIWSHNQKGHGSKTTFYYLLPKAENWYLPQYSLTPAIKDMTPSNSTLISDATSYTMPSTPGVYNFTFYIAISVSGIRDGYTIIKKVTQPILVTTPWTELAGTTVIPTTGFALPNTCDKSKTEGQKECDNGYLGVWGCEPTVGDCSVNSVKVNGGVIVSTGRAGPKEAVIPSGVSINIKNDLPGIVAGDKFYIVTDLLDSSWVDKQYAYTEFVYGKNGSKTYKPYTRKTNVHTVSYDGVNTIKATSVYTGADTKFSTAKVNIKEVGNIDSLVSCRNIPASEISKMFNLPSALGILPLCTSANYTLFSNGIHTTGMYATAAGGSHSYGRPSNMSVNVCAKSSDVNSLSTTEPFYVLVDSIGTDWIETRYDIFNFNKGVPKDQVFSAPSKKYNIISGYYDGACTVNFVASFAGHDSNYTRSSIDVIEIGPMNSSLCYFNGVNYPANFNRGVAVPNIPKCVTTNITTCTDNSEWRLKPTEEPCSDFLSCIFKNSIGVNINTIELGKDFSFLANYATTGPVSNYSYSWDFGSDADPSTSNSSGGTAKYVTTGQKIANLKVSLNGVVVKQEQCSALNVVCGSGNCPAGCGVSEVGDNQGLDITSSALCPSEQSLVSNTFSLNTPSAINLNVWSWKCKNNKDEQAVCLARCGQGLSYCSDTNICSATCVNKDKCSSLPGNQGDDDLIYTIAGCSNPKLTVSVKAIKPYADDVTSKCSINWSTVVSPSSIPSKYTLCRLDDTSVSNNGSGEVFVGTHNLVCETKIEGLDFSSEPRAFVTSGPVSKSFKCSRSPSFIEK